MTALERNPRMAEAHAKNVARHREELAWIRSWTLDGEEPDFLKLAVLRKRRYSKTTQVADIELKLRRTWARRWYWDGQAKTWYSERDGKAK